MDVMTLAPWVTAIVAVIGLIATRLSSSRAAAKEIQRISDQLTHIQSLLQETREDVRDVNPRVTRVEVRLEEIDKRLTAVEDEIRQI